MKFKSAVPGTFSATKWIVQSVKVPVGKLDSVNAAKPKVPVALSKTVCAMLGSAVLAEMLLTFSMLRLKFR